jgi:alkylation response protein AidB-like acyl-CoA dehydrogenase
MTLTAPAKILESVAAEKIRGEAFQAEVERNLTKKQQDIIHRHGWLNMYVPREYGGLELSFPEILRTEESLSWADGSTAWVVTLCSGASWFIGFLDPGLAREIFTNTKTCFAGSGAVTGTANKTHAGYAINGYWHHATGALLADVFTVNCKVLNDGIPLVNENGEPVVISFLLMKSEVIVHETWNAMGMISTGSHAMEVKNKLIPLNRAFTISPSNAFLKHPVYQYPFLQLAEATLSVNLSGMVSRFLELSSEIILKRERRNQVLDESTALLSSLRAEFFLKTDAAWETLLTQSKIPDPLLSDVSDVSHRLAGGCRKVINDLYPLCGLAAADTRSEINRVWRNFHTAAQHALFRPNK